MHPLRTEGAEEDAGVDRYMLRHNISAEPGTEELGRQYEAFIADIKWWYEVLRKHLG